MLERKIANVLIVEDDEDDYIIIRDYLDELQDYNFSLDWVSTPQQAISQLKQNAHDICLLDYQLGAYTGLSVLTAAKEAQSRIPIIMLTGQSDSVLDRAALDAGAVDFVVKNELDSPRFSRAILYALARHDVEKERLERINLETKSRAKDRFLAHLSHELRTPLTSIIGYTELLLENPTDKSGPAELNIILNNSKHLLSLLNDVLDLSKISANKLELNPNSIYTDSFLADILTLMQVSALDNGIDLSLKASTELPQKIYTDPTRLRQILINLIHNAIKFTEEGSVKVDVSAQQNSVNQVELIFNVHDTGPGISQKEQVRIFQPFEQVEDTITKRDVGAGLGLAISSELANKLGGEITVTSTMGEGSCFTLTLKLAQSDSMAYIQPKFEKATYLPKDKGVDKLQGKVLVVDDLQDIRMLVGHVVRSFGLEVEFAANGQEAVDKVTSSIQGATPFDAVIMDIHMPKMDGKEAIVKIRQLGFDGDIIALTAATMKGVGEQLKNLGFNYVMSKPVDKLLLNKLLGKSLKALVPERSGQVKADSLPVMELGNKTCSEQSTPAHILLVEDDFDAAEITKLLLENMGAKVYVAHTGNACLHVLAEQEHWHKILLDLHLPDIYGIELAKKIQSYSDNGQCSIDEIILVTGEDVPNQVLIESGCHKALLKPLNKEKLRQLIAPT